jgi:hypothetical protein
MAPGKERVIARIPATGSAPAVDVLPRSPTRESDMPSFGTMRPLAEKHLPAIISPPARMPMHPPKPVDRISLNLMGSGVDHKANVLFDIVRMLQPELESLPFRADSRGIFIGEKKIGRVIGSASGSPELVVWMDWLFRREGTRPSNFELLGVLPIPIFISKFRVWEIAPFVNKLASTKYTAITADKFLLYLKLYDSKTGPELDSFRVRWPSPG